MANYYNNAVFVLAANLTPEETAWLNERADSEWWEFNHEDEFMGFEIEIHDRVAYVSGSDESIDLDHAVLTVREFLSTFRPKDKVAFSWGNWCDKDRVDGFDGGAVVVSAKSEAYFNPMAMAKAWLEGEDVGPRVFDYSNTIDKMGESVEDDEDR